jgi:ParB-like chromosome segregation protein Spo0J
MDRGTTTLSREDCIERANAEIRSAYAYLSRAFSKPMPVGKVQWVHIDRVQANDYNPNAVAHHEMRLLYTSIDADGYTQPVVAVFDPEAKEGKGAYIIVDGFHRYSIMQMYEDVYEATGGYLPVVVIDKPVADRLASTVRHNRARGKHSIAGMSSLVFQMLGEGESDATICNKLGLEAEELARLKHLTGFSKLFANIEHSPIVMTKTQLDEKAKYKRENPEEVVPPW